MLFDLNSKSEQMTSETEIECFELGLKLVAGWEFSKSIEVTVAD